MRPFFSNELLAGMSGRTHPCAGGAMAIAAVILVLLASLRACGADLFVDTGQSLLAPPAAGGNWSRDVALGDVDGDGDLDAVVVQGGGGYAMGNALWLNNGTGSFQLAANLIGAGDSVAMALADFDGDTDLDLWIADVNGSHEVYRNDGTGGFSLMQTITGDAFTVGVAVADMDGDGDIDAVILGASLSLWTNNGGVFSAGPVVPNTSQYALALGDLDGDGDADIVLGGEGGFTPNQVWWNDLGGDGGLLPGPTLIMEGGVNRIALADLDGDNRTDIFFASTSGDQVWWNGGDRTFTGGALLGMEHDTDVALGDLDGDGDLDAFVARRTVGSIPHPNGYWLNQGGRVFALGTQMLGDPVAGPSNSFAVALGDLDRDGDLDVFIANSGPNEVYRNVGAAPPSGSVGTLYSSGQNLGEDYTTSVALGDFDGDGDLDAVTVGQDRRADTDADDPNLIWVNQGGTQGGTAGRFVADGQRLGTARNAFVGVADFDLDGSLDIAVAGGAGCEVWTNLGPSELSAAPLFGVTASVNSAFTMFAVVADFDQDGYPDIATAGADGVRVNFNLGASQPGQFSAVPALLNETPNLAQRMKDMVAADFDGDGWVDIIAHTAASTAGSPVRSAVYLWRNSGERLLPWAESDPVADPRDFEGYLAASAADLDEDGLADLMLVARNTVATAENVGAPASFAVRAYATTEMTPSDVAVGDLDGDGVMDAVVAGNSEGAVWRGAGSVWAGTITQRIPGTGQNDVALGDLDNDGDLDAWIASSGPDHVWLNGDAVAPALFFSTPPTPNAAGVFEVYGPSTRNADLELVLATPQSSPVSVHVRATYADVRPALTSTQEIIFDPGVTRRRLEAFPGQPGGAAGEIWNPIPHTEPVSGERVTIDLQVTVTTPGVALLGPTDFSVVFRRPAASAGGIPCLIEAFMQLLGFPTGLTPQGAPPPARARFSVPADRLPSGPLAQSAPDITAYRRFRDEVLATTPAGQYYTDLYTQTSEPLVQTMTENPWLLWDAYETLVAWTPAVQARVDGQGNSAMITPAMVAGARQLLEELRLATDDATRARIDMEIAALDPDSWAGLSMDQLLDRVEAQTRPPPTITAQPAALSVAAGGAASLGVEVDGAGPVGYQWYRDGTAIAGATGATYDLPSIQHFHSGDYTVEVTNPFGSVTSSMAAVAVATPAPSGARVANLSTRALGSTGDRVLIPGFVIAGTGTKRMLVRAVGPGMGDTFGIPGFLDDPYLSLRDEATGAEVAANDDWGTSANRAEIIAASIELGAFPLLDGSRDAALLLDLPAGRYTAPAHGTAAGSGIALVELYDADPGTGGGAHLVNISTRGFVDVGDRIMIPGFVVSSEGSRTFLIRAVGPGLRSTFNLQGVLEDPDLAVIRGSQVILANEDWDGIAGSTMTASVAQQVGAFPLDPGSTDAAFVVTLPPGPYTVHATGRNGGTGIALVEIYLVP